MKYVIESIEPGQESEVYGCHMWESNWVVSKK